MQIFLKDEDIINKKENDTEVVIQNRETYHHLVDVLRIEKGENLVAIDKNENIFNLKIVKINKKSIIANGEKGKEIKENQFKYILFQGIPKSKKLDDIVEKTTEIGIDQIIPIEMERSIVKKRDFNKNKEERLKSKAESASAQSKRNNITEIHKPIYFSEFIKILEEKQDQNAKTYVFVFYEKENKSLKEQIKEIKKQIQKEEKVEDNKNINIIILIGPEGGISEKEIEEINKIKKEKLDIYISSLGKNILRTETAGIVALSILKYELES